MKEKKDCKIVQDLLPNYIEKLTNEETNNYIEDHLKECENCKKILTDMQGKLDVKNEKQYKSEKNYLKKFNRKYKTLIFILILIFVIFIIVMARKVVIINNLYSKAEQIENANVNNIYTKQVTYTTDLIYALEIYNKNGTTLARRYDYKLGEDIVTSSELFKSKEESFILINNGNKKEIVRGNISGVDIFPYSITIFEDEKLFLLFSNIQKVKLENKDCYMIKYKNKEQFIEIETGLLLKYIDNDKNETIDYYYEFGTVTDNNIEKPDISEYTNSEIR